MYKIFKMIMLLLIILTLSSCVVFTDRDYLSLSLKNDRMEDHGNAACVYYDRIYYLSNEQGDAGIYSMNFEGTDVRIELKNPSVTHIQIVDDTIYFIGLREIAKKVHDPLVESKNKYSLYFSDIGSNKYSAYYDEYDNISGFSILNNGYKLISGGNIQEEITLFNKEFEIVHRLQNEYKKTFNFYYKSGEVKKDIYGFDDLIAVTMSLTEDFKYDRFPDNSQPYFIDINNGGLVFKLGNNKLQQKDVIKAYHMDEENIYCSYNEMVVILDKSSFYVKQSFIPDGLTVDFNIDYMTKLNGYVYIMADKWSDTKYKTPPLKNEILYRMNPDTFKFEEVLNLKARQRILAFDDKYIIMLDNGVLYKLFLDAEIIGEKEKLCDAPPDIYSRNHMIDIAGDWMFIYSTYPDRKSSIVFGSDLPGQHLYVKVNMETGEIISNNVELDFSALDNYKLK
ncbi:MAG: hypothetical protein WDA65_00905 [Christensenellales bacterium]